MDTMTKCEFRAAAHADLDGLSALVEDAYRGDGARRGWTHEADLIDGRRSDIEELGGIIADPRNQILLAFEHGDMIGCVQVTGLGGGRSYLGLLAVDPARQAGGLGRALIRAAEEVASRRFDALTIEMMVNRQRPELIAYYERRGYAQTGEERAFPQRPARLAPPTQNEFAFVVLEKLLAT